MISAVVLFGAAIVGVGLIAAFWRKIREFLVGSIEKIRQKLGRNVDGCRISLQRTNDGNVAQISRNYSYISDRWHETKICKKVPPSEIPAEFLEKVGYREELDITDELEMELSA